MLSVRTRLTAWSIAATAMFLIVFGVVTYALLLRVLQRRMDASLVETALSFEHALRVERATDTRPLEDIIAEETAELPFTDAPLIVFREKGEIVAAPKHSEIVQRLQQIASRGRGFVTLDPGTDDAMRVFTGPITVDGRMFLVVVARRLDDQTEFLEAIRAVLFIGIPIWIAIAGALGYWLVRTPLAIVRGEAEVALSKRERSAGELRESLEVIEQESRLLSSVIDDLFLLARADAGQAVLAPTTFYLDELITEVVRSQRTLAAKKSIGIASSLAPETTIHADERLVRRMLMNLIDNAVKYTPEGGRVEVALCPRDDAFVITIANSGPPIADDVRAHIFERFYRGNPSAGEGAGLGLPIAQSIAELHGGRIDVSNEDGNVFRVVLGSSS